MAGSAYMSTCFAAGDHYRSVPAPITTPDPSCNPAARIFYTKRVPNPAVGSYDPYCEVVTSYGITKIDGQDMGWLRVDNEGSDFDPNSTITRTVSLGGVSPDITVYDHVWPRFWDDPLAYSTFHKETSLEKADKLRSQIAKICLRQKPK